MKNAIWYSRVIWSPIILFLAGIRFQVIEKAPIDYSKSFIYVSNHESLLDIPVVSYAVKKNLSFVAKKELKKVPFLGWFMLAVGTILVDRFNKKQAMISFQKAGEQINQGNSVISFAEGTRTKTGEMGFFKRGSFLIAQQGKVDIIPLCIKGTREVNPSGKFEINGGKVQIMIGEVIKSEPWFDKDPDLFAKHVENIVRDMRKELDATFN
ncbi:MAG: 1-acyl-sn-glycerol-3-phosphate acyltransferase [Sphingobacteriales bacterium]|jgi:1-acyl-sn-glycerol-3-phosphate acyltransferase